MIQQTIFKIQKNYNRWAKNKEKATKEGFVKSLTSAQLFYFEALQRTLTDYYKEVVCFRHDNAIIVEYRQEELTLFFTVTLAASECMIIYTKMDKTDNSTKHVETRYFNSSANLIFDGMLEECLKRKRRDHENMRNSLIIKQ